MGLTPNEVTAIIVTRGDCDLTPIRDTLIFDDVIVWDNSQDQFKLGPHEAGAFGRYIAIQSFVTAPVIYVQDDDCIVHQVYQRRLLDSYEPGVLSALMPPERDDYTDTVLVGWGALFDRHLPSAAFRRWLDAGHPVDPDPEFCIVGADFVFPMLTVHKRLSGEHVDLPHAHAPNRTWGSYPDYAKVKERILQDARMIRDS